MLTNVPTETYQIVKDLVAPNLMKESTTTYTMIVEKLQRQLKPQKSTLVARCEFDNRARLHGETVSEYVVVLKDLATECKFSESMRLARLRDRIVSGIRDKRMMSELLKLKLEELTFDVAVTKCSAIEQSYKDVEALQRGMEVQNPVNVLSRSKQRPRRANSAQTKATPPEKHASKEQTCYRCTGQHDKKSCPFKKEKCHYCKKQGHLKKVCKKRLRETQGSQASVNNLFDDQESSGDELPGMYHTPTVYSTTSPAQSTKPLRVSLQVERRNMVMELDTGSAVSIISENAYCDNLKHIPLKTSDHQLRTYTSEVVRPIGVADVKVVYQDQTKTLPLCLERKGSQLIWSRMAGALTSQLATPSPQLISNGCGEGSQPARVGVQRGYGSSKEH